MRSVTNLWMEHCVRHGVTFEDCARGAQVLLERDEDGALANEAYYLANRFKGLQAALIYNTHHGNRLWIKGFLVCQILSLWIRGYLSPGRPLNCTSRLMY
jgi:hypothetical protein